jgi:hypothetical protein
MDSPGRAGQSEAVHVVVALMLACDLHRRACEFIRAEEHVEGPDPRAPDAYSHGLTKYGVGQDQREQPGQRLVGDSGQGEVLDCPRWHFQAVERLVEVQCDPAGSYRARHAPQLLDSQGPGDHSAGWIAGRSDPDPVLQELGARRVGDRGRQPGERSLGDPELAMPNQSFVLPRKEGRRRPTPAKPRSHFR